MLDAEYHVLAAQEGQHWWYRTLRRRVLGQLRREARRQGRPLAVFDAGCGTGGMLQILEREPAVQHCGGCDASPVALDYCRSRGLAVQLGSVNDPPGTSEPCDAVLSLDVLYHRDVDPPRAMAAMVARLRPGGLLLLNVAAMPALARRHDRRVLGARRFRAGELRRLAEGAGLQVEQLTFWNSWLTPLLWLQARLERERAAPPEAGGSAVEPPPAWLNRSLGALLALEGRISRLLPLPWGSSLFLRARRPAPDPNVPPP